VSEKCVRSAGRRERRAVNEGGKERGVGTRSSILLCLATSAAEYDFDIGIGKNEKIKNAKVGFDYKNQIK
jgi:hypothetical protein